MAINQDSQQGKALQAVIQGKLKETEFLGPEYADTVLPLYITVMLAHNNTQKTVTDSLKAFLGAEKAPLFSSWLFAFLAEHRSEYVVDPQDAVAKQASISGGSTTSSPGDSQIHADTPEQRLMQPADNGAQAQATGEAGELPAHSGHLHGTTWSPIRHPSSLEESHRHLPSLEESHTSTGSWRHRDRDRPRSSARTPEPEPIRRLQQQMEEGERGHFRDGRRHNFRGSDRDRGFRAPGDLGRKGSGGRYSPLRDRRHSWNTDRRQEPRADWHRRPGAYQEQRTPCRRSCSPVARRQQYQSPPDRNMHHRHDSARQMFGRSAPTRQQQIGSAHRHPSDHQEPVMSLPRSRQQPQRGGQSPPQQLGFDVRRLQSGSQERLETRSVSRAHGLQSGLQGPPQPTQADLLSNRVLQMDIAQQEWCREQQLRQQQRLQEQQQRLASLGERWQHDGAGSLPFSPVPQDTLQVPILKEPARRQDAAARDSAGSPTQAQTSQPAAHTAGLNNSGVQHRLGRRRQNGLPHRSRLSGRLGHRRLPERPCQLFESAVRQATVPAGPTTKGSAAHLAQGQQEGGSSVFDRLHTQAASGDVAANATAAMVLQQLGHYIRQAAPGPVTPQAAPAEIDEVKAKLRQMELEVTRLKAEQRTVHSGAAATPANAGAASTDAWSVVVHNVHFGATVEVVAAHFAQCGAVQRVTLLHDKATGKLKGMAYVEFATVEGAANARSLQDSLLMQRPILVVPKQPRAVRPPQRLHQRARSFPLAPPPHQVHTWHSGSASRGIQKRQRMTSFGPGRTNKYVRPTPLKQASLEVAALQNE